MRSWLLIFALTVACKVQDTVPEPTKDPVTPAPKASAAVFGSPIHASSKAIALNDAPKHKGETVLTEGKVTRVCQERGCWLALHDGNVDAVVRMKGHAFFVPTTSAGKHARVEGTVMLTKDGKECDEMEAENAKLEIDATGVELD
jgi:hypothetical protein